MFLPIDFVFFLSFCSVQINCSYLNLHVCAFRCSCVLLNFEFSSNLFGEIFLYLSHFDFIIKNVLSRVMLSPKIVINSIG